MSVVATTTLALTSHNPRSVIYNGLSWRIQNEYEGFITEEPPSGILGDEILLNKEKDTKTFGGTIPKPKQKYQGN